MTEKRSPDAGAAATLDDLPPLRTVIAEYGLGARRSLGQHFLLDLNITRRIARAAGDLTAATVIEVGPGPGGLTRALLERDVKRLYAVEADRRCVDALSALTDAARGRLEVIADDATRIDIATLGAPPRHIVANLPYNVATVLLIKWLRTAASFAGMTLMFQKEVAERIVAGPGSKTYGRLSVMANWLCETRLCFNLPARAFTPPPKVASSVVHLEPYEKTTSVEEWSAMETVTAAAFGQRRKMLRSALRPLDVDTATLLSRAGVDPAARAERLTVAEFATLAQTFTDLRADP
ncbi:MAG: 16S rRNA (adenine(1518)-N(6)/adenine(1519)-N(6))-dimethyltransferase RsmA [Alphaproteobacteria bacterium]|nr:16S rRNA (adenine(1518)-N(6)/adenine(1519)-N(6))-dimethyltransferase RsmA [Alphaproteobacteria bacterium]